jgi:hypothetical protein
MRRLYTQDNRAVVEALPRAVPLLMKLCAAPTTTNDSNTTTSNSVITTSTEQQQQLREGALRAMVSLTFVDRIALAVGYSQSSAATSNAIDSVEIAALSLHGAAVLVAVLREWNTAAVTAPAVTANAVASSVITATTAVTAGATAGMTRAKLALLCLQNLSVHGACRRAVVDAGGVEALVAMHGCDDPTIR